MNFKELAYSKYGKTLSELFLINYSEKLWGKEACKLSPDISGGRLKNLNLISIIKQIFHNKSNHLDGDFLYPKYGFGHETARQKCCGRKNTGKFGVSAIRIQWTTARTKIRPKSMKKK